MDRVRFVVLRVVLLALTLVLVSCTGTGSSPAAGRPAIVTPAFADEDTRALASPAVAPTPPTSTSPFASDSPAQQVEARACGVERWSVKTGADPEAKSINTSDVRDTTIAALDVLPRPSDPTTRVAPVETTVYRLHAALTYYKLESDRDIHLVLSDGGGHTMIAEIPSPSCDPGSAFATQIAAARRTFDAAHREGSYFVADGEQVTVTGVGFFDFDHGQRGVAPNSIELHPVLSLAFG